MSETIRLNKVLKELNISIDRAVDFLSEKGIQVERTPNTKINQDTYGILIKEFQSDAKQKAASEEVVINKIPERKPEPPKKEEPAPKPAPVEKVITTKVELEGPKTIGKIDLDQFKSPKAKEEKQPERKEPVAEQPAKVEAEPKPIVEDIKKVEQKPVETIKEPVVEKAPVVEVKKEEKIEKPAEVEKPKVVPSEKPAEPIAPSTSPATETPVQSDEPVKIETKYQKLDGPNFTGKNWICLNLKKTKNLQKIVKRNKSKKKKIKRNVNEFVRMLS